MQGKIRIKLIRIRLWAKPIEFNPVALTFNRFFSAKFWKINSDSTKHYHFSDRGKTIDPIQIKPLDEII